MVIFLNGTCTSQNETKSPSLLCIKCGIDQSKVMVQNSTMTFVSIISLNSKRSMLTVGREEYNYEINRGSGNNTGKRGLYMSNPA